MKERKFDAEKALLYQTVGARPRKSDRNRAKILEAAIHSLSTKGFDETTFDAVGKLSGLQRTHVSYYFSSRHELFKAAVQIAVATGQRVTVECIGKALGWRPTLEAAVSAPFEWLARYPEQASVLTIFYHFCTYDERYQAMQKQIQKAGEDRLFATLHPLVDAGKLSAKTTRELASLIHATVTGRVLYASTTGIGSKTLRDWKKQTVAWVIQITEQATDR